MEKEKYTEEEIKKLQKQRDEINAQISLWYKEKKLETVQKHEKFIGKCYKEKESNKYYKVLSCFANNEYCMTCLTFDLDTEILTYHMLGNMQKIDFPFIRPEIELFEIEDVFTFSSNSLFFETVNEISPIEFYVAVREKYQMFLKETRDFNKNIEKEILEYKEKICGQISENHSLSWDY